MSYFKTILHKRSDIPGDIPDLNELKLGEISINTHDGKMYIKKDDGTLSVIEIGGDVDIGSIDGLTVNQVREETTIYDANVNGAGHWFTIAKNGTVIPSSDGNSNNGGSDTFAKFMVSAVNGTQNQTVYLFAGHNGPGVKNSFELITNSLTGNSITKKFRILKGANSNSGSFLQVYIKETNANMVYCKYSITDNFHAPGWTVIDFEIMDAIPLNFEVTEINVETKRVALGVGNGTDFSLRFDNESYIGDNKVYHEGNFSPVLDMDGGTF